MGYLNITREINIPDLQKFALIRIRQNHLIDTTKYKILSTGIFEHVKLEDDKSKVQGYIMEKVKDAKSIRALADELILAQWIAFGMEQAQTAPRSGSPAGDSAERKASNQ